MSENTVTIDGVEYDFDSISEEAQVAVSIYQEAQQELISLSRKADIQRAAMITLQEKIKEFVKDDNSSSNKEASN
jgi:hypothetical protein